MAVLPPSAPDIRATAADVTAGGALTASAGRDIVLSAGNSRTDLTEHSRQSSKGLLSGSSLETHDELHSNWQSVAEQTGIFAGKGGFDVTAGEHTQLNGAVISSTATADKNRLDTGTLGFSNIENHADYKTEHQSVGMSTGGSIGSQFEGNMANGLLAGLNGSGSASSVTKAAVSDGTLIIRDKAKQTQDVADLNRDAAGANPGLDKIFDKDKEQRRMETAQLLAEIGSQAGDIARTQGEIAATRAATEKMKNISPDQKKDAEAQWRKANPGQEPTAADITGQVYQTLYNREMLAGGMGTGGPVQQGISAATAAIQGLAGGDLKAALAGGSAPYLAELIKQKAPDEASRIMAHAAVAGVIAAAQGNSAAAGAAGAATTAAMGEAIKNVLYGDVPVSQLSEQQKQTLVALGTVAAGLAGGLAGETTADTVAGAQAGQNEISNNMVSMGMLQMMQAKSLLDAAAVAEAGQGGANEQAALALTKKVKAGLDATCLANTSCVIMAVVTAQQHTNGAGSKTETVPVNDDLTGGKLVNPAQDEKKGTSLVTPDQSGEQGSSNTGNTDGMPDTGGNTTVTPISEQNKDDLAYLAEGDKPANLSPEGAGRSGAFNEAKRQSGIPVSQSPNKVSPNIDKRGNPQPGYIYEFIVQKPGGGTQKVYIRDDAGGHFFGVDDPQNRGSHFNDPAGNHYDY
ncbi:VENN motif pre-toxin domain-containing protein [Pantoea agglomerans]|uniref:VENN motif pre-toxin domain-containing protein n=1 Tax=Enterobacter agglomerans TaxID=549 RepID=UPI00320ABB15